MLSAARRDLIWDLLAPPLILATPFVSFLDHNDYDYAAVELWIALAALIALGLLCGLVMALGGRWPRIVLTAGLVTLFVDLQLEWLDDQPWLRVPGFGLGMLFLCWLLRENLSRVTTPIFGTMLVSTIVLSGTDRATAWSTADLNANDPGARASGLPTLVHIVLDEHIGIEGIPTDVPHGAETKAWLKSFFGSHGFRLLGGAYSRYAGTRDSVPNLLNYASSPIHQSWVEGRRAVILKTNKYFEDMHRAGYQIHAFQIAWLDLCRPSADIIQSCYTEDHTGIKEIERVDFPVSDKVVLLYQMYAGLSVINRALHYFYTVASELAERNGLSWPRWWSEINMPGIRAMYAMSVFSDGVARAQPGQLFFAHILLPHNPYVYDAACNVRDLADWEQSFDPKPLPPNTEQSRARRYELHFEQLRCLYRKLEAIFDRWRRSGVFEHSIIIIHGDHGSRIYLHEPEASNVEDMVSSDYADAFSTLLAVKAPAYASGYDVRRIAIQDLLPTLAQQGPLPAGEAEPYVFLETGTAELLRRPLPDFDQLR